MGSARRPAGTLNSPSARFGEIVCAGLRNAVIWIGEPTVRPVAGSDVSPCRLSMPPSELLKKYSILPSGDHLGLSAHPFPSVTRG